MPPELPLPVPGTDAEIATGLPDALAAIQNAESMQPLHVVAVLFALGDTKRVSCVEVDDRGGADANLGIDVSRTRLDIRGRYGSRSGCRSMRRADHAGLPQRRTIRAAVAVGVEGVNRIMLVSNEDDVMSRSIGQGQIADIERLRVDLAVHRVAE